MILNRTRGTVLCRRLEVARTPARRARGLMLRKKLEGGMLFVFPREGRHRFWTAGMRFPIDILWLDREGRVVGMKENAPPWGFAGCPKGKALHVLELKAGTAAKTRTKTGDVLEIPPLWLNAREKRNLTAISSILSISSTRTEGMSMA